MKFLLDTNVISETWKPLPDPAVRRWLGLNACGCVVPSPVLAEIADGNYALPPPRRAPLLQRLGAFRANWSTQILAWDAAAAVLWGEHQPSVSTKRQPQSLWDSIIEALALSRGLIVATRNTGDFRVAKTINPWLA
jgi:toxin FitB